MSQLQKLWAFRSKPKHKVFLVRCSSTYQIVSFDCPVPLLLLWVRKTMCYADTWIHCNALLLLVSIYVLGHTMPLPFASHQTHRTHRLDSSFNRNPISSVAPLQKYPTPSVSPLCKWNISNIVHIFQVCGTQDMKSKDLWLYHNYATLFSARNSVPDSLERLSTSCQLF